MLPLKLEKISSSSQPQVLDVTTPENTSLVDKAIAEGPEGATPIATTEEEQVNSDAAINFQAESEANSIGIDTDKVPKEESEESVPDSSTTTQTPSYAAANDFNKETTTSYFFICKYLLSESSSP